MNVRQIAVALLMPVLGGALTSVAAQTPPPAAPQKPIVWPAVNSQMGVGYPISELENTLTFTLESVSLATRFAGTENVVAAPGKRLLVLTCSLVNIQNHDYPLSSGAVGVNAFSETGERSVDNSMSFVLPGLTSFPVTLKPKEKLRFVMVMSIHGQGPIKRVGVFRGSRKTRRAWYDVQKDLGTVASVFADGADLRDRADAQMGKPFDLGAFDMTVEKAGPVVSAGSYQSSASTQVYAVTLKVTNTLRAPAPFGWQYAKPTLVDVSGQELSWKGDLIDAATGKTAGSELAPGQTYTLQYPFTAERGRPMKTFTLAMTNGRTIVVDLK